VAYYDPPKRGLITDAVALLRNLGADPLAAVNRDSFPENTVFAIPGCLVRLVANKFKKAWSFSRKELSFFCSAFEHLLRVLDYAELPAIQELIDLRMDFYVCQWIIAGRLIGVPELKRAGKVEHFNHSDFVEHVTLEQMNVAASLQDELASTVSGQSGG